MLKLTQTPAAKRQHCISKKAFPNIYQYIQAV